LPKKIGGHRDDGPPKRNFVSNDNPQPCLVKRGSQAAEYLPSNSEAPAPVESAERGWIKVWRRFKEHPRYRHDSEWVHVWLHLQLCATHAAMEVIFKGQKVTLEPGQLRDTEHQVPFKS
jgi:hypothetical protein